MGENKQIILQLFGSLMKRTNILFQPELYSLTPSDFNSRFEKSIFSAIYNLAQSGAETVSFIDVDNYLAGNPVLYEVFEKGNGIEFLQDAEELSQVESFDYYYTKVKKENALRDLRKMGFNTEKIKPTTSLLLEDNSEQLEAFEQMSVQDIFESIKAEIAKTELDYGCSDYEVERANLGIEKLLQSTTKGASVGKALQGDIFNTIARGAIKGKYYLMSAGSGMGKSRTMVGHCCHLAYPVRYNQFLKKWENVGGCEKVLYVATEQKPDEIKKMILAYLSGINQDKMSFGQCTQEEMDILYQCIEIMNKFEDNLIISRLPEPNIGQVKSLVRNYCLNHGVEYVFYDYIFTTPSLLGEFKSVGIRNDQVLRMLSTELKDLSAELQVFVMSATQITGDIREVKGIRNELCLRDSKSIPDKADIASITAKPTKEELEIISSFCQERGLFPNQVTDVYKNREGRYTDVRIWSRVDLGTLRREDLFITDAYMSPIEDFQTMDFCFNVPLGEYATLLGELNSSEELITSTEVAEVAEDKKVEEKEIAEDRPPREDSEEDVQQAEELVEEKVEENTEEKAKVKISVDWGGLL